MTIIDKNTIVVITYAELKSAIESTNEYNYIYLGADITLTGGITIPASKTNLTIDGTYQNTTYTFTDRNTLNASDTISAANTAINKVSVQNMNIIGNNYYGIIYVPESSAYKNIIIEYNNITYEGPQICFHPTGLTRFIDSTITIKDTSLTAGGEVAECNQIELGGTTTITHNSKGNSAFWFRNSLPSLTILENAKIKFTSPNRELFYGTTSLAFRILKNAEFEVTTYNGLAYDTFGTGITTIAESASFTLKQTAYRGSYPAWYSYGPLTANENSTIIIVNNYPSINTSNYNIYFSTASSAFILNNPKKVILYNSTANALYTNTTTKFDFKFSRINLFNIAIDTTQNISKTTLPTFSWYKSSNISEIKGTFTNAKTTIESSNFTESNLTTLPALTNFNIHNKKIISIGLTPLLINPVTDESTTITGIATPNSSLLIKYDNQSHIVVSNSTGAYTLNLETPQPEGTNIEITVKKQNEPIYQTKIITIVYVGEITIISAPTLIEFKMSPISKNPLIYPKTEDLIIKVSDTRAISTAWNLFATINHDPTDDNNNSLEQAIIYKKDSIITPLSENKTLVYEGKAKTTSSEITTITFAKEEGILLQILSYIKANANYKATITWTIEEKS